MSGGYSLIATCRLLIVVSSLAVGHRLYSARAQELSVCTGVVLPWHEHSWLAQFTEGRPRGRRKDRKRGAKIGPGASLLLESFGSACLTPRGCIFLYFLNKTEL